MINVIIRETEEAEDGSVTLKIADEKEPIKSGQRVYVELEDMRVEVEGLLLMNGEQIRIVPSTETKNQPSSLPTRKKPLTQDEARRILVEAGVMSPLVASPENRTQLTEEERIRLGTLAPGARLTLDLINEDREDRA